MNTFKYKGYYQDNFFNEDGNYICLSESGHGGLAECAQILVPNTVMEVLSQLPYGVETVLTVWGTFNGGVMVALRVNVEVKPTDVICDWTDTDISESHRPSRDLSKRRYKKKASHKTEEGQPME